MLTNTKAKNEIHNFEIYTKCNVVGLSTRDNGEWLQKASQKNFSNQIMIGDNQQVLLDTIADRYIANTYLKYKACLGKTWREHDWDYWSEFSSIISRQYIRSFLRWGCQKLSIWWNRKVKHWCEYIYIQIIVWLGWEVWTSRRYMTITYCQYKRMEDFSSSFMCNWWTESKGISHSRRLSAVWSSPRIIRWKW